MEEIFTTAQACENAFYAAFEARDLDLMMRVWASHTPIMCVHPGAALLHGRDAVMSSWRQIFSAPDPLRFTISDQQIFEYGDLAVRVVHENIHHGPAHTLAVVLATNVFVRRNEAWTLCSHHASPTPPPASVPSPQSSVH